MEQKEKIKLLKFAAEIRMETLREIKHLGFGHIGGALSMIEALAVLYGKVMNIDVQNPKWSDRDYFVCSKGHSGPSLYATLALKGFFPKEELLTLNQNGTKLPSHCDMNRTPGIDMSTGSLGQGVSAAVGIALGNKVDNRSNYTYLMVGDGELNEGQCWEGFMFAAHNKLDNLVCFVDENKKQLDGYTADVNNPFDLAEKFRAFGWNVFNAKGDDVEDIYEKIQNGKELKGKPVAIILETRKGQGVKFVEDESANHHMRFTPEDVEKAEKEIVALEKVIKNYGEQINE